MSENGIVYFFSLLLFIITLNNALSAEQQKSLSPSTPKYQYSYQNKYFSNKQKMSQLGIFYGVSWLAYRVTQPSAFANGSKEAYKGNFGSLVFDNDEPVWNWVVHSLSGSQLFLFYRALGHSRSSALGMLFISSALFEFTVEVYTEPASVQDLYQTPIFGSLLGVAIENFSLALLNSNTYIGKFFGHLINPATLFWFYDGKIKVFPKINSKSGNGILLMAEF